MCKINLLRSMLVVVSAFVFLFVIPSIGMVVAAEPEQTVELEDESVPRFELEEVVVTGAGADETVRHMPKNITVITREDIKQAPSNNVVDLLARESGVNLRSFFGHDKHGGVDIRGMGDTFVSNVLVLVDGVRLNPPDMAGPDLSSIPLDQIERIEIMRGAGSVVYGDGAVGGVVNIITKKGDSEPEFQAMASYGSYETSNLRAGYGGRKGKFKFNLSGSYYDSKGYRDNGSLRKNDGSVYLGVDVSDKLKVYASAAAHYDEYGLPGPVSKEEARDRNKRETTRNPDDSGETRDQRYKAGFELNFTDFGNVKVDAGFRNRENEYIMGYNPLISKSNQTDRIDEDSSTINCTYDLTYKLGGHKHSLRAGFDYFYSEYLRNEKSRNQRHNSEVKRYGAFILNKWSLPYQFALHAGYRHNSFEGKFRRDKLRTFGVQRVWVNGTPFDRNWENDSYDLGIVYSPSRFTDIYFNYATSFRTPNVDEFALADSDLHPQKGEHLELGLRRLFAGKAEVSVNLFQTIIEDEIYYGEDPSTGLKINRNYDQKTIRRGVELDIKLYLKESFYIWGNASYIDAVFEETKDTIPLVPNFKASLGFEWKIVDPLLLAVTGTYVGSRYDGNDLTNDLYEKLDAYQVVDAKLTYSYRDFRFFVGVNNIFDELYSTVGYSETYYTMPGRNFYMGLEFNI